MNPPRLQAILSIVAEYEVATQRHLSRLLARRGHKADQATLSRDLRKLGVAKVASDGGRARYRIVAGEARGFGALIKSVERAGSVVVVKTDPGDAGRVGLAVDGAADSAVAGTVAGDDTLLVVVRDRHSPARVARKLKEIAAL